MRQPTFHPLDALTNAAALAALLLVPTASHAINLFVDASGTGAAPCASAAPCPRISDAVAASNAGDVVLVAAGTYAERRIRVPHTLAIIGAAAATTIVDGGGGGPIFIVDAPGGQVLLSRLTLTNGDAGLANGGAVRQLAGELVVEGSRLLGNDALAGGAISQQSVDALVVLTSDLEDNTSSATGGAISCDGCGGIDVRLSLLRNNTAGSTGGAINTEVSTLDVWLSDLSNNVADYGGAVHALDGTVTIRDSALMSNRADAGDGGAVFTTGTLDIERSTLAANSAYTNGGAVLVDGPISVEVSNSTFSGNSALCGGAFSLIRNLGLGPFALLGTATFYGNVSTSAFCGGQFQSAASSLELYNSIVAGGIGASCNTAMTGGAYNLIDDASCDTGAVDFDLGPVTGLDPTLAYNGGPTKTHLIDPTSNAVDAGRNAACLNPATGAPLVMDQRDLTRPVDFTGSGTAVCDIGAVELQ